MSNLLYTYEEVCDLIKERNLPQFEREDSEDKFLWQFTKTGPSLHVRSIMQSRYVLYASERDFNTVKRKADAAGLGIALRETKKEEVELVAAQYEEVASKAILFIKNGNRGLNMDPLEKSFPHVVIFFTNENLEFVLDIIKESKITTTKSEEAPAAKAPGRITRRAIAARPALVKLSEKTPDLSDDQVKEVFPEGCTVFHDKYGKGTVTDISDGKITVIFDGLMVKIFSAGVCVNKKILTVA